MKRLPIPILDSTGLYYLSYDEAKLLKKTDERDRQFIKIKKEAKQSQNAKNALPSSTSVEKESVDLTSFIPMTAQIVSAVIYCVECELPQEVIYSKNKLNHNQHMLLAKSISNVEYSSGAFLLPPDTKSKTAGTHKFCAPRSSGRCKLKFFIMDKMVAELINAAIVDGAALL